MKQYQIDQEEYSKLITVEVLIINKMKNFPTGAIPTPDDVEKWMIEYSDIRTNHTMQVLSPVLESIETALKDGLLSVYGQWRKNEGIDVKLHDLLETRIINIESVLQQIKSMEKPE